MKGWRNESLSAVCEFINRGVSPNYLDNGGIAVLNQKCVRDHEVNHSLGRRHDIAAKKVTPDRLLRAGDVLVNSTGTGTLGRVAQLRSAPVEPTTVDSHVTIVRPVQGLFHPEFFGYALIAIEEHIQAGGEGCGGQTELSRSKLANEYHVGFPVDLQEQRRIVAILDDAFEGIATAKANAEKNLRNAQNIFDSHLESIFSQPLAGWAEEQLGRLCQFENGDRGTNYPNRSEYVDQGIPWINTGHILPDGRLSKSEMNFISQQKFDSLRSGKIKPGDLVYCLRGATLGKTALVDPLTTGAVASSLVIIRPNDKVAARFLYYFLVSPVGHRSIKKYENGAAQPNLGAKSVAQFVIHLPPKPEQGIIVESLDALSEETKNLAALYQQKLTALEELKKSLLHQAFSGQL